MLCTTETRRKTAKYRKILIKERLKGKNLLESSLEKTKERSVKKLSFALVRNHPTVIFFTKIVFNLLE